jgi:hypothetical protein
MKMRIKNNSLRFRVTRSDLANLINFNRIEETIYLAPDEQARLTYALEHEPTLSSAVLRYQSPRVAIVLPTKDARAWAETDDVGIYARVDLGVRGALDLIVEKDFACLDLSDAENIDTFPNPNDGSVC